MKNVQVKMICATRKIDGAVVAEGRALGDAGTPSGDVGTRSCDALSPWVVPTD